MGDLNLGTSLYFRRLDLPVRLLVLRGETDYGKRPSRRAVPSTEFIVEESNHGSFRQGSSHAGA